jgi:hypothetical protein
MIVRDLGFQCKFLVRISNDGVGSLYVCAYFEDFGAFVAKQFWLNTSFGRRSLNLLYT